MGGAGGHMWHPFDCPDVNSGQDLIDFFKKSINSIKESPCALKIDGVNLSFRLREAPNLSPPFEFVVDRGSMKDLDVQGITSDNVDQRFISKDPDQPHGMIEATKILLGIFNNSLPEIIPELEQLQMTSQSGHFGLYFNTEFVLKKINVKEYPFNFIAIHGVKKFEPKGPKSRQGVDVQVDKQILDKIRDKVEKFANEQDFKVFTSIPARMVRNINLDNVLNEDFTIVYSTQLRDHDEESELGIGEGSTKPLKVWLAGVSENPINKVVRISDTMISEYPKMGKKQSPYAKNIYLEVLKGTPINDIAESIDNVEAIVDGVVVMHATRILGNAVLDALESDEFGPAREQEGCVIENPDICGGTPFKLTGDFILGGLATSFRENKFKAGELLKEITYVDTQKTTGGGKFVILIPGGFKPPTGGHYHMIKQYDKNPEVLKVFVITGAKPRGGVTFEQSKRIFEVYGGFSDKVEFKTAGGYPSPTTMCYELMKDSEFTAQFPNAIFSLGASDKGDDPKRIQEFVKYFENNPDLSDEKVLFFPPAETLMVGGKAASASRMRQAVIDKNWRELKVLLPHESVYNDVLNILDIDDEGWQDSQRRELDENFLSLNSLFSLVNEVYSEKQRKWACAQADEPRELTKKQAKEMCASEVKENQLTEAEEANLRTMINTLILNLKNVLDVNQVDSELLIKDITAKLSDAVVKKENEVIEKKKEEAAIAARASEREEETPGTVAPIEAPLSAEEAPELEEASSGAAGSYHGGSGGAWGNIRRDYYE